MAAALQAAWPMLVGVAVRVALLVLAAQLGDHLLRRRSASLRHAIWRATLGGTLALGLGAALPAWPVALLPQRLLSSIVPSASPARADMVPFVAEVGAPVHRDPGFPTPTTPVASALVVLWLVAASLMLVRLLLGRRALARSMRSAHAASGVTSTADIAELAAQIAQQLGITRPVRVLFHARAIVPYTFGVRRATLMLPHDAMQWRRDRLERVLTHELAHVLRGDASECVLMQCVTALLWFHPAIWLLSRRLAATRESACDDIVLLRGARASDYATDLLDAVRGARAERPAFATPAMVQRSELGTRLTDVLDATRRRRLDARAPRRLMVSACLAIALPLAALHPVARPASTPMREAAQSMATTRQATSSARTARPSSAASRVGPSAARRAAERRAPDTSRSPAALVATRLANRLATRLATLDSICAITNGRTRGALLVALADDWVEDAQVQDAYFRVLNGIPDARVRANVVVHALNASPTAATLKRARRIIEGFPDRGLRDAMAERLHAVNVREVEG